jgi:hypothetical protein
MLLRENSGSLEPPSSRPEPDVNPPRPVRPANLAWRGHKLARRAWSIACGQLYRDTDRDPRHTLFIAGTARSGTTWLADLVAAQSGARLMFEPFQPHKVPAYRNYQYFQYMRLDHDDPGLTAFCEAVFTGRIRNAWIDRQIDRLRPRGRVIKEIRANLLLAWIRRRFPAVPMVFLLRHPCAVVLSRLQLGWDTDMDIEAFLVQPELVEDHLQPYLDVIARARTDEEKHAVVWAVSNLVPLRQLEEDALPVVYYEDLCIRPEPVLRTLSAATGTSFAADAIAAVMQRPSQTTVGHSAIVQGTDPVRQWQRRLDPAQIDRILAVVGAFGLDGLYDADPLPRASRGDGHVEDSDRV